MRTLAAALVTIAWASFAAPATSAPRLFPKEVYAADGGPSFPEKLHVEPLWPEGAIHRSRQRMRMFIGGFTVASWSVELEEKSDGRVVGLFRQHNGRALTESRRFAVSKEDYAQLADLISRAKLWEIYPEFYQVEELCIDGMTIVLERADARGYRYAEGNAQCSLGGAQKAVAAKMFELAGEPSLKQLLH